MRVTEIQRELEKGLSRPVILAEQSSKKPKYPYATVKVIVPFDPSGAHPSITDRDLENDIERTATSQPQMSLSVTIFGKSFDDSFQLAQQAHDWFAFKGYRDLKDMGYVVASIEPIMNRDSLIIDDYERRQGFDISLRFVHRQSRVVEEIKSVKTNR